MQIGHQEWRPRKTAARRFPSYRQRGRGDNDFNRAVMTTRRERRPATATRFLNISGLAGLSLEQRMLTRNKTNARFILSIEEYLPNWPAPAAKALGSGPNEVARFAAAAD